MIAHHPRRMSLCGVALLLLIAARAAPAMAGDLVIQLPEKTAIKSAVVAAQDQKREIDGKVDGSHITFADLRPGTSYDVRVTLADGAILQGVDLAWYTAEPPDKDAAPLDADDRKQIAAIVQDIPGFYNKRDLLHLRGDHTRATALLRLVRDKDFYNGKGEIIWRIELWYFKNEAGGWAAIAQQNKVLRRERFKNAESYKDATAMIRWIPGLGGIRVPSDKGAATTVEVTKEQLATEK